MLRDLLVRVSAGLLSAAIAISCSHSEDQTTERVGSVEQAATLAGAGGEPPIGSPGAGGAPPVGSPGPGAGGAGGAGGEPATCDVAVCEAPESCTHCVGNACVRWGAQLHVCRPAAGPLPTCDAEEMCTGLSDSCPADAKIAKDTQCRAEALGGCDVADKCDGKTNACTDNKRALGTVCRAIEKDSLCDVAELCDGTNIKCPDDDWKKDTFVCRPSAPGSDGCDPAELCTGKGPDCPTDAKLGDGSSCTSSNKCSTGASCLAGLCLVNTTRACDPQTDCIEAGTCNTVTGDCDYENKPNTTSCNDLIDCTEHDHCQDGACAHGVPNDLLCAPYDTPHHVCAAVTCEVSAKAFPGHCRINPVAAKDQLCRAAAGACDVPDKCNGISPDCPLFDEHKAPGTECVPAACGNDQAQPQVKCDGGAQCPVVSPVSCDGYACVGKMCGSSCATSADCNADHYCLDDVCEKRVDPGKACDDDSQCSGSNPFCIDGVCCDTKCDKQCEACDVKDQEGTCTPVTGDPHGKRTACKGDGSLCNGSCGGSLRNSCVFKSSQTECLEASCDAATGLAVEQAFCDGGGNCAATEPLACSPYACGATACRGDCVSDAQCDAGSFCKAGKCVELEQPGGKCARDAQCLSGFCTDGVCCEGRCEGQCESCGSDGKCSAVSGAPVGMRPACSGEADDDCAGACDGSVRSSCGYPGGDVVCRDAGCSAGVATVLAHCTGAGACAASQTVTCPNGCEGAICAGDGCLVASDCKSGEHCVAGTCAPQGSDGAVCGAPGDCQSGFCVDGVCCDRACDGQCEACDGAKKPGVCAAVSGAPHGARVPCTSDGSACAGACDGREPLGCAYPDGTVCNPGSCAAGQDGKEAVATREASCNGSGRCPAPREQACGDVGCDAKKQLCNGDCADGSACPSGRYCSAGVCVTNEPTGTACQTSGECASGFCVDGYCCGSACDDRCAACDVPGSLGKCSPVSGSTHGARPGCLGGGVCGAQCDGKNVTDCGFPDDSTACGEPYCSSGTAVGASACDGAGQCRAGEATACASFSCAGTECSDGCTTDADCTRALQCHEGQCVEAFKINAVDQGTCGCKVPGGRPRAPGGLLALAVLSLWSWRRRGRGTSPR